MDGQKVKRALLWSGLVLITLAGGTYWGINLAMNKMLHALSSDVKSSLEEKDISIQNTPSPTIAAVTPVPVEKQNEPTLEVSSAPLAIEPVTTQKSPTASTAPITPTPAASSYDGSISEVKAKKAEEQITLQDKALVTSILLKRFSSQELSAFMNLASGGLSIEEKVEAKKLVMKKLSEDEYNQLISIAAKLNLSQGKNYKDSLKDLSTPLRK